MRKKLWSLLLVCAMIISLFAACGKKEKETTTPDQGGKTAEATKAPVATDDKKDEPVVTEEAKPEYSEITVEVFDRGTDGGKTDPTNNFYTDWIKAKCKEELNLGVTFVAVSRWEETDKLNTLMAAGTAPDVCLTYSNDLIANYRDLGGLTNLAPYVDSHLADLKAFLGPDKALEGRDMIMRNVNNETGELYSIPARRMNTAALNTFIRKDWVDKLGLSMPTTTDEFVNVLKEFKAKDPGGVGTDKVIPFTMTSDVQWRAGALLDSFVQTDLSRKDRWVNTVVDRNFLLPGYKEGARLLNQMYNDGLVDVQFPLYADDTDSDNLIKSGVVGSFIHNWDQAYRDTPGLLRDLKVNVPDAEIVTIDPFKTSAGTTEKRLYDAAGVNWFIPANSKNVEGALRYVNWLSKFENRYFLQIGEEGVTHEMVNGVPKVIPATNEKIMNSAQNIDYTIMINGLDINDDSKYSQALAQSYTVDSQLIMDAYANSMKDGRPAIIVPVQLSAAGPYTQTLQDKGKTLMADAVTCKPAEFDKVWDAAIADWLASGAQEIIDERSAKYVE